MAVARAAGRTSAGRPSRDSSLSTTTSRRRTRSRRSSSTATAPGVDHRRLRGAGRGLRSLYGRYLYGDFCAGELRSFAARPGRRATDDRALGLQVPSLSSFGEDNAGHLYATSLEGPVYRLVARRRPDQAPRGHCRWGVRVMSHDAWRLGPRWTETRGSHPARDRRGQLRARRPERRACPGKRRPRAEADRQLRQPRARRSGTGISASSVRGREGGKDRRAEGRREAQPSVPRHPRAGEPRWRARPLVDRVSLELQEVPALLRLPHAKTTATTPWSSSSAPAGTRPARSPPPAAGYW